MQDAKANNPALSFEESLDLRIKGFGGADTLSWIYQKDIKEVWEQFLISEKTV